MTDLAVEVSGEGPPLLLIQAAIGTRRQWDDLIDRLPGYTHVRYDVRGFGDSPDPTEDFFNSDDARQVLDDVGIDRAVVVGASNGGRIAAELAAIAPERVAGLVLVSPAMPGQDWGPEYDEAADDYDRLLEAGEYEAAAAIDRDIFLVGPYRALEDVEPALVERLTPWFEASSRREATHFAHGEPQPLDPPLPERLGDITAPTLVVVGEHDPGPLQQAARRYADGLADATGPVVVEGAAHLPAVERPDDTAALVREHLDRLGWR